MFYTVVEFNLEHVFKYGLMHTFRFLYWVFLFYATLCFYSTTFTEISTFFSSFCPVKSRMFVINNKLKCSFMCWEDSVLHFSELCIHSHMIDSFNHLCEISCITWDEGNLVTGCSLVVIWCRYEACMFKTRSYFKWFSIFPLTVFILNLAGFRLWSDWNFTDNIVFIAESE